MRNLLMTFAQPRKRGALPVALRPSRDPDAVSWAEMRGPAPWMGLTKAIPGPQVQAQRLSSQERRGRSSIGNGLLLHMGYQTQIGRRRFLVTHTNAPSGRNPTTSPRETRCRHRIDPVHVDIRELGLIPDATDSIRSAGPLANSTRTCQPPDLLRHLHLPAGLLRDPHRGEKRRCRPSPAARPGVFDVHDITYSAYSPTTDLATARTP